MTLLAIILVLGAVWSFFIAARPEVGFFLEEGWKFRDAEPSDLYLGVTRFGSAAVGIACLIFAAILAFGGPDGVATPRAEPSEDEEQVAQEQIDEWIRLAQAECDRLMPTFGKVPRWDAQGKLTNPEALRKLATREGVELKIDTLDNGSNLATVSGPVTSTAGERTWLFFTIGSWGTTCIA